MSIYADIAFPTAVRSLFTYRVDEKDCSEIQEGLRVWVPFRNYYAIGVVVSVHSKVPDFKTKKVQKILDTTPILSTEMLALVKWAHQFYFCSWGEVIQAALPAGLNFISQKYLRIKKELDYENLDETEKDIIEQVLKEPSLTVKEANIRWWGTSLNKVFERLLKKEILEVWERPDIKTKVKKERAWNWAEESSGEKASLFLAEREVDSKWSQLLEFFVQNGLPKRNSELKEIELASTYSIKKLKEEGWIRAIEMEVPTETYDLEYDPASIKQLNEDQKTVFQPVEKAIDKKDFKSFLLYGITGSGKTEVYIQALKKVLESGRGGIVLVPEIALTPQTVARFYKVFGEEIAILHSRLSNRERLNAWNDLQSGKKNIAIGPRSAVFAPVKNLGLIILDEEHDSSYKQDDPAPRYHARETAIVRAKLNNAVVIMGSATPSMQALHMAAKKKAELLELKKRHADAVLPEVHITDLRQYKSAMRGSLAVPLYQAIDLALSKKEQVILLYNRRGFGSYLQCRNCGHIPQSPECSVSLTYHKKKNMLMCHYSGYARKVDTECEECGAPELMIKGAGTQKVEEEIEKLFPSARVIRFDRDSTARKGSHEKILTAFGDREADILIGTQLVAKGLDFPNVTVAGVIDADTELAFPSFQSTERMYQLLSQVAGRSGRGEKPGKVFIQTMQPENPAIQYSGNHDHVGFSKKEMSFRKPLNYPPYSRIIKFVLKSTKNPEVEKAAHSLKKSIEMVLANAEVLGPSPAPIAWKNRNYYWEVLLKISPEKAENYIERLLEKTLEIYDSQLGSTRNTVRLNINVDVVR